MKRFIFSVLAVTVFCVGLGSIVDQAGAAFKSDEKALAIIRDARQAIGGDTALIAVRSMVIGGNVTRTIKIDGADKTVQGESEIAMQLPDKLMKTMAIKDGDGTKGDKMVQRQVDVVVVGDGELKVSTKADGAGSGNGVKKIVIKKDDGTVQEFTGAEAEKIIAADGTASGDNVRKIVIKKADGSVETTVTGDGDKAVPGGRAISINGDHVMMRHADGDGAMKQNEMLRLTLGLLLTAPQGMDVNYTYDGETDVDGTTCNVVVAETGGSAFKLFIGKSSNLPVMMTYKGIKMPNIVMFRTKSDVNAPKDKADLTFTRKVDAPAETAEFSVKFSDYRSTGGLQLPFKWTQTVGGTTDEVFDVALYDINPANIADKFNNDKVRVKIEEN